MPAELRYGRMKKKENKMAFDPKVNRLIKTARGQLDGILKMIDEDRECIDISTQILATQSILKKVNVEILTSHLSHCVRETFEHNDNQAKQQKIEEVVDLLNKILK